MVITLPKIRVASGLRRDDSELSESGLGSRARRLLIATVQFLKLLFIELGYLAIFTVALLQGVFFAYYFQIPGKLTPVRTYSAPAPIEPKLELHGMDWFQPRIRITNPTKRIAYTATDFILQSDEKVTLATLPEGWSWQALAGDKAPFYYVIKTANIGNGTFPYELKFVDLNENSVNQTVTITANTGRPAVPVWPESTYHSFGDNLLAIANKRYRLAEDYVPGDLVTLSTLGIPALPGAQMRREAAEALKRLNDAMAKVGISNYVRSAYRSYTDQVNVYSYWVSYNGSMAGADRVSARPGHSEHQLGTTADFGTDSSETFATTPQARWLRDHAHEYGFVMSYPDGKEGITGYTFEPWHYRYVGVEDAAKVRASGLTLTEWLYEYWGLDK